jgi:hypothetical protein
MKLKSVLMIFLLSSTFVFCKGQEKLTEKKCDIDIITFTNERIDSLNEAIVLKFLSVFDATCNTNVEFSEYSNEVLFAVLEKRPDLVIIALDKYSYLSKDYILKNLQQPVNDEINIEKVKDEVAKVKTKSKIKEEVIKSLLNN